MVSSIPGLRVGIDEGIVTAALTAIRVMLMSYGDVVTHATATQRPSTGRPIATAAGFRYDLRTSNGTRPDSRRRTAGMPKLTKITTLIGDLIARKSVSTRRGHCVLIADAAHKADFYRPLKRQPLTSASDLDRGGRTRPTHGVHRHSSAVQGIGSTDRGPLGARRHQPATDRGAALRRHEPRQVATRGGGNSGDMLSDTTVNGVRPALRQAGCARGASTQEELVPRPRPIACDASPEFERGAGVAFFLRGGFAQRTHDHDHLPLEKHAPHSVAKSVDFTIVATSKAPPAAAGARSLVGASSQHRG